jgi:hypothetical protein
LALGVGANTAIFSVVHGVLLKPLPYPDADRIVEVFEDNTRAGGGPFFRVSLLNYLSWVDRARTFDALAAFNGRDFVVTEHGDPERVPGTAVTAVAIVSEGLARRLWAEGGAIGRVLEFDGRTHEVVGVVEDIRGNDGIGARGGGLDRGPGALLYLSSTQFPQNSVSLVIRSDAPLEAIQPAIRAAVRDIDRAQPISDVRRLDEWIAEAAAPPRLTTTLAGAFAIAASLLTAVGVYGVVSYTVSQRTQEIGMRMALGANRTSVLGLVVRGGLVWAGSGIVLGLFGAWSISRAIASLLFDVSPADPLTFAVTALALAGVTGLACTVPALRAACIDPIVALRAE